FTWDDFQLKVFTHLCQSHGHSNKVFAAAHNSHQLVWVASISGSKKYDKKVKFQIQAYPVFLDFASATYLLYPNKVLFKLVMLQPWGPGQGSIQVRHSSTPSFSSSHRSHCDIWYSWQTPLPFGWPSNRRPTQRPSSNGNTSKTNLGLNLLNTSRVWAHSMSGHHSLNLVAAKKSLVTTGRRPVGTHSSLGSILATALPATINTSISVSQAQTLIVQPGLGLIPPAISEATTDWSPLGPESKELEAIGLKKYSEIAHIDAEDQATQHQLKRHRIQHWMFFHQSTEYNLAVLGFPLGVCCLLCEGV
ncbi:hypothetical protein MJO28_015733, partial [Puccinia striiformis f. sp. tritici]